MDFMTIIILVLGLQVATDGLRGVYLRDEGWRNFYKAQFHHTLFYFTVMVLTTDFVVTAVELLAGTCHLPTPWGVLKELIILALLTSVVYRYTSVESKE